MEHHSMKNIEFGTILELANLVDYQPKQVVSRTLSQNKAVSVTLFAFDENEEISSHTASGDALVTILEGTARITIGEHDFTLTAGQSIAMPAGIPHALLAVQPFKMQLTVIMPPQ